VPWPGSPGMMPRWLILFKGTVEHIIGRQLDGGTTKDLARNEAGAAIDTLKRCGGDWDKVKALTEAGDKPDG
jgi:hypothetical protein